MAFNSLAFALFLPIVFVLYWLLLGRNHKSQNAMLLVASYLFYGWWDWRFCGLLLATTLIAYFCALAPRRRKFWAGVSVVSNLLILGLFKYFNFFSENLQRLFSTFGFALDWFTIEILLPVGISFYTFQAISYSVDAYRGRIEPTRDFVAFALFVSFFPQLVAGPIERSTSLLPQFLKPRTWNYHEGVEGLRLILWGLFKKCVVADGMAYWVDLAYDFHAGGGSLYDSLCATIGALGFAIQIYGDFSGYSDIAKGSAKLLGIRLMDNFLYPFFSRNAIELWQRWHRSLMQWLREYVYFPLGGSRRGNRYWHAFVVFLVSGLWHGASWNFVVWGILCGVWYIIAVLAGARKYRPTDDAPASRRDLPKCVATFLLFSLVFIFFRAESLSQAVDLCLTGAPLGLATAAAMLVVAWIVSRLRFSFGWLPWAAVALCVIGCLVAPRTAVPALLGFAPFVFAALLMWVEWRHRTSHFALESMPRRRWVRVAVYVGLYLLVVTGAMESSGAFIYFKF